MSNEYSETSVVRTVARLAADHVVNQTIFHFQSQKAQLSGDDSELENVWDEICFQIQYEQSYLWDVYLETIHAAVAGYVDDLPHYQRVAIWHQTRAGRDWLCEEPEERKEPYSDEVRDAVVQLILEEHLFERASKWSNERIRAYIARMQS